MTMKYLVAFVFLTIAFSASADDAGKSIQANHPVYDTVHRPYNYPQYDIGSYGYGNSYKRYDDSYKSYGDSYEPYDGYKSYDNSETFGAYPAAYDLGSQRLHLSGGIFRPYGYDDDTYSYDTSYQPYSYDSGYKYYGSSGRRYVNSPYVQQRRK